MKQMSVEESLLNKFDSIKNRLGVGRNGAEFEFGQYMANDDLAGAANFLAFLIDNLSDDGVSL